MQPQEAKARDGYIDSLRFLAFFGVFFTHILEHFVIIHPDTWLIFYQGPIGFFTKGLYGKAFVALFCVLAGYYAAQSAERHPADRYLRNRYIQFSSALIPANFIYILVVHIFPGNAEPLPLTFELMRNFFSDSLFYTDFIVPTYWCMIDFFIGSVVTFLLAQTCAAIPLKQKLTLFAVAYLLAIITLKQVWLANCLLGGLVYFFHKAELKTINRPIIQAAIFLASLLLYRSLYLSYRDFAIYGLCYAAFFYLVLNNKYAQELLNKKTLSKLGLISFELYLAHAITMPLVNSLFIEKYQNVFHLAALLPIVVLLNIVLFTPLAMALSLISGKIKNGITKVL